MGSGWVVRYAAWIRRHHRAVLLAGGCATLLGLAGATRLRLDASMKALLPSGDRSADAVDETERRLGGLSTLVVVLRSPHPDANRRYASELTERVLAAGDGRIERAVFDVRDVQEFVERNRWLFADEAILAGLRDRLRHEIQGRENPLFVDLEDPPTLDELEGQLAAKRAGFGDLGRAGVLGAPDGKLVALVIVPAAIDDDAQGRRVGDGDGDRGLERLVERVLAEHPPSTVDPAITWRFAGEVHTTLAERRSMESDIAVVSAAVVLLVGVVVLLYFGRWRALPLMTVPVGVGVALAMGLAGVAFGALNATSAFLGSIIVGNGINYPILQLARYEEERARGRGAAAALDGALAATLRPTALAAFAAAAAYASLALTRFRGFSQFGVIGAAGMVLCWAASMTVLPALIWALDGRRGASVTGSSRPPRRLNFGRPFAQLVATAPLLLVVAGVGLSVLAVAALPRWLADPFEYDFEQLRRISDDDAQAADLDGVFGRALAPSVLLAQSRTEAAEARRVVLARAGAQAQAQAPSPVAKVVTLDELLPGTPDEVARKLALLVEIRRLLSPANLSLLSDEDQRRAADLRPPANLRSYDERALPPLMRRPFTERDGTLGRVVLIYPPTQEEGFSLSNGRDLIRLSDAIRDVPLADGRVLHATGRAVIFAAMLESIAHDGPVATGASFAAVALITCLLLARRRTGQAETAATAAVILGTLALGVLWMLGMAAAFGVKLNVLNFVALPITFGIGVDYAANVYLRYRWQRSSDAQDPAVEVGDDVTPRVLRSTGGAVVLNSLTTVLGYGTLLLAHSRALRSFGALAVLGELGCLAAAMLLMPAVLTMAGRRRRARVEGRVPAA